MKSYDMTRPIQKENDVVVKHKAAKDKVIGKSPSPMETESDILDDTDLDDIDDTDDESNENIDNDTDDTSSVVLKKDDVIRDSIDNEAKIENPMWKTNEKRNERLDKKKSKDKNDEPLDTTPIWQKPPSRMSTKAWLLTLIILLIPGLNILMLFIWAFFSDGVPEEKKNFCRASISLCMIMLIISVVFGIAIGGFRTSFDNIKNKASVMTEDFKNYTDDALRNEANSAQNNYNNLTDDDFTN